MYEELVKGLRDCPDYINGCKQCRYEHSLMCRSLFMSEAANAIEELSRKYIEERNAAVELTGELASKPCWISVEERLPDQSDYGVYLCHIVGGEYDQLSWYELCNYAEGRFWVRDLSCDHHVTHWMRLPEPPKEVE